MRNRSIYLLLGLCLAGFVSGRLMKGSAGASVISGSEEKERVASTGSSGSGVPLTGGGKAVADTLASLEQVTDLSLYRRLALWLVHANESEVATFWESYCQRENRDGDVEELILLSWTRLDAGRAVVAARGTEAEDICWVARACNDPKAALDAAKSAGGSAVANAAYGVGEYRPAWLREHFDEIPENVRYAAYRGWDLWPDNETPLATLKFLHEQGSGVNRGWFNAMTSGVHQGAFKALVRTDPFGALDWLRAHGSDGDRKYDKEGSPVREMIDSLAATDPQMLQKLADAQPSSDLRRKMEAALFERSLKDDPEGALALARSARSPRTAANEMAKAALVLGASDPERARAVCQEILKDYPHVINPVPSTGTAFPGRIDNPVAAVSQLIDSVVASDPAALLATASSEKPALGSSDFDTLSTRWAAKDLDGYAKWVNEHAGPEQKGSGAAIVTQRLSSKGDFQQAVEWSVSTDVSRKFLVSTLFQWAAKDPDACQRWMKSATLSAEETAAFESLRSNPPRFRGQ